MSEVHMGPLVLEPADYRAMNARQKETYNFHKIAARLADYGYNCLLLSDDWQGADFIAYHHNGKDFYRVQLKGRLTLNVKYEGKGLYIAFFDRKNDRCYVYPHDLIGGLIERADKINSSKSWSEHRSYSWPSVPAWASKLLAPYEIPSIPKPKDDE
ncbi:hypothetical protein [Cognatishimia sp. MH4019]|uniref:hypothetical protein n=1 Tax=Cognatishimia sp. MH4019 TaxID=2854030 RepID=UPI001CD6D612|nr:hypothetical protein [Cognatishimia sp. MH4019]